MLITFGDVDIPIEDIDYEISPIIPAKTSGDPNDCYPQEGGDITIHHVWKTLQWNDDKFVEVDILPLLDYNSLIDQIQEYEREKI
jgi:hypothetical protein